MTLEQYFKNLQPPKGKVDAVLDTDTFNEVDDQFALSYMLASSDRIDLKAIYAAPFFNRKSTSPEDGMLKSYDEIMNILKLAKHEELVEKTFKGSCEYLKNETKPVISDAASDLVERAKGYSPENPLYVVAIGAITNVASALLIAPEIKENIVIVWLGGHSYAYHDTREFNMYQDVAAARVVFGCGAPLIQLPCQGVVSNFLISYAEMECFLKGKSELCDFLVDRVKNEIGPDAGKKPRSRVIWDVTAVAWLLNDNNKFMLSKTVHSPIPEYDDVYAFSDSRHFIQSVYQIDRDMLAMDLFDKLLKF